MTPTSVLEVLTLLDTCYLTIKVPYRCSGRPCERQREMQVVMSGPFGLASISKTLSLMPQPLTASDFPNPTSVAGLVVRSGVIKWARSSRLETPQVLNFSPHRPGHGAISGNIHRLRAWHYYVGGPQPCVQTSCLL